LTSLPFLDARTTGTPLDPAGLKNDDKDGGRYTTSTTAQETSHTAFRLCERYLRQEYTDLACDGSDGRDEYKYQFGWDWDADPERRAPQTLFAGAE
jgi:hypothetical protein